MKQWFIERIYDLLDLLEGDASPPRPRPRHQQLRAMQNLHGSQAAPGSGYYLLREIDTTLAEQLSSHMTWHVTWGKPDEIIIHLNPGIESPKS